MIFNIDLPIISIILCACTLVCCLTVYFVYIARVLRVSRACRAQNCDTSCECTERASIVVYAHDQAEDLARLLPTLLEQEYEPGFEVIVVNDGGSEDTRDLVERMRISHDNLYQTFTPNDSRALSRKKLALTLGIKAARNPVIVNITAEVIIESSQWLSHMMRNFADASTDIVLGYALPQDNDHRHGRRRRIFDWCASGVTWLTSALAGKPYRGTEYNLAYRSRVFFDNKGFSRSLNLNHGDDDIFISEIATGDNCRVELSQPSIVRVAMRDHARKQGFVSRRHQFTGRFVRKTSRRLMTTGSLLSIVATASAIAATITAWPNLCAAVIAAILILALYITIAIVWRTTLKSLGAHPLRLTLPYLMMTRPLRLAALNICLHFAKDRFYTWR
jgi:hypothetical protein